MTIEETVESVATAENWNSRIALIRLVPERFGTAAHQEIYSAIARRVYVPSLAPDFAYVHWHEDYELPLAQQTYDLAHGLTNGFTQVTVDDLVRTLETEPATLRVFRLILGFTAQEFAAATSLVVGPDQKALTTARIRSIEGGRIAKRSALEQCAAVVDLTMTKKLFGASPKGDVRLKTDKPDTILGWTTLRQYASGGVPLSVRDDVR